MLPAPVRVGLRRPLLVAGLGLVVAAPLVADDTLIRRDGERSSGRLTACVGEICQWDGAPLRREQIAWIGLGESGVPPVPADPSGDAVWTRDGRALAAPIVGVSLGVVATEGESFDRPDVAWIYFGSAGGAPPLEPAAPPPPRGPPPRAAQEPPAAPPRTPAPPAPSPQPPATIAPAAPDAPARLLLNEVAALGDAPFVELRNPSGETIALDGAALRNGGGAVCTLPAEVSLEPEEIHLVRLGAGPDAGGSHCPADFLASGAAVELVSQGSTWDRLEWGDSLAGLALRTRGGRVSEPRPGASFGRPPGGSSGGPAWVRYSPSQVTPGAANPVPAVDSFAALPGALFERADVPLTWYTVGGASRYRVEVASSPDFASPALDRIVETGGAGANAVAQLVTDPLPDGTWYWRVKALGDGVEAPASEPQSFAVETAGENGATAGGGATAGSSPNAENSTVVLGVPWIEQAKDTRLLALEADSERGPDPWDAPWENQPPYCARASIAMVNRFYRGKASQDRINHSIFHDWHPEGGPEIDLLIRTGLNTPLMTKGYEYALGVTPSARWLIPDDKWEEEYRRSLGTGMFIWQHVVDEIDAGRPVIGTSECHVWVYGGYRRRNGQLQLLVLDPAMGVYYFRPGVYRELTGGPDTPAGSKLEEAFFVPRNAVVRAASDEATVASDGDEDGVMDFDEGVRFGTKVDDDDSDGDGVPDKAEIRASVFEPPRGWLLAVQQVRTGARYPFRRDTFRDLDGDGLAMELDPDSDGGGCKDGEEDLDGDGRRDPGEPSNFDPSDDPFVDGVCDYWTGTSTTRYWSRFPENWLDVEVQTTYRLRASRASTYQDPGPAHGGRRAGDEIARQIDFSCEGTELQVTWSGRHWSSASNWVCTCEGHGSTTLGPSETRLDGFIHSKLVDWDLTPIFGFDLPREGGMYAIACQPGAAQIVPVACTCTDSGSSTSDAAFPPPGGLGLGNPLVEPRCNHDPEVRTLAGGGNQMVGTYSVHFPECAPQGADVAWSLCKAGTPCAPLPPLPDSRVAEPEGGASPPR